MWLHDFNIPNAWPQQSCFPYHTAVDVLSKYPYLYYYYYCYCYYYYYYYYCYYYYYYYSSISKAVRPCRKRSHKKRTRDPWNTRCEIQIQTKLLSTILKESTTPDFRNTPSTTNLEDEDIVGAPGHDDGNASLPEQVKRLNPWRKIIIFNFSFTNVLVEEYRANFRTGTKYIKLTESIT